MLTTTLHTLKLRRNKLEVAPGVVVSVPVLVLDLQSFRGVKLAAGLVPGRPALNLLRLSVVSLVFGAVVTFFSSHALPLSVYLRVQLLCDKEPQSLRLSGLLASSLDHDKQSECSLLCKDLLPRSDLERRWSKFWYRALSCRLKVSLTKHKGSFDVLVSLGLLRE